MQVNNEYREKIIAQVLQWFRSVEGGEQDIFHVGSNKLAFPFVNGNGNDEFVEITVSIPRGSRDGGGYDGYELKEEYEMKVKAREEKKKADAIAKEKKIKRDKEFREKKKKEAEGE